MDEPESTGATGAAAQDAAAHDSDGAAAQEPIRVFVLDDFELVRMGIRDLLDAEPGITVVGEAGTAAAALARIPAIKPDVAILDIRLPDGDGISVCRELRSSMPELACLMLTSYTDDEALFGAIMAGAEGYVLKQIRGNDLVAGVRSLASGQSLLDPEAVQRVMHHLSGRTESADPLAGLTHQERRILALIGEGLTNRQIGDRLFLAEKTVKNYVSSVFTKLGMHHRSQAAAYAVHAFDRRGGSQPSGHEPDVVGSPAGSIGSPACLAGLARLAGLPGWPP
jgi:two-component system response regulator DevR